MAQFPCDMCGQRYHGKQQTAYPAIVNGTYAERGKRRLCPRCLEQLTEWISDHLVGSQDPEPVELCFECAKPEPELAVFLTLYRDGADREDWYGRVHSEPCRPHARMALFGSATAP